MKSWRIRVKSASVSPQGAPVATYFAWPASTTRRACGSHIAAPPFILPASRLLAMTSMVMLSRFEGLNAPLKITASTKRFAHVPRCTANGFPVSHSPASSTLAKSGASAGTTILLQFWPLLNIGVETRRMSAILRFVVATSEGMSPMVPTCILSASSALTIGGPVRWASNFTVLPGGRYFSCSFLCLMITPFQPPVQYG